MTNVPNDVIIRLSSDSGVDQSEYGEIVVEDAWHTHITYKGIDRTLDYFDIYANEVEYE